MNMLPDAEVLSLKYIFHYSMMFFLMKQVAECFVEEASFVCVTLCIEWCGSVLVCPLQVSCSEEIAAWLKLTFGTEFPLA